MTDGGRGAPFADYDDLTASDVIDRLAGLDDQARAAVLEYEAAGKARKTILDAAAARPDGSADYVHMAEGEYEHTSGRPPAAEVARELYNQSRPFEKPWAAQARGGER